MEAAKTTAEKPPRRGDPLDDIPPQLQRMHRWMGTRFRERPGQPGKTDKPPYRVREGLPVVKAAKTDPDNWASYEEARAALERGDVDAIGFVFMEDDPYFALDLDEVIDPETGEIKQGALEIIHALSSYTELSCSGTGVHVIATGVKPDYAECKSRTLGFETEVYDKARFIVLTGNSIGAVSAVEDRQQELDNLCRRLWPQKRSVPRRGRSPHVVATVEDHELLERARRARTGARFRALHDRGDTSGYGSQSEADFAEINALIFWTAGDEERIIRLFKASALYREEKHAGYVETSVSNALASYSGPYYRPRRVSKARKTSRKTSVREPGADPLTPYLEVLLDPSLWISRRGASAYKAYTAAVIRAAENGIVDGDGRLRVDCDVRTLAEIAGCSRSTLQESALPYLVEQRLLRWQRGQGRKQGQFVLLKPTEGVLTRSIKVSTHFNGPSEHNPDNALDTLRLLIRMRTGRSKRSPLARLGMVAMFVIVALVAGGVWRGQTVEELAQVTGRRKPDLRRVLKKLEAAQLVRELAEDSYLLAPDFREHYERELEMSGITYSEREQRRQHREDREKRDDKYPVDKQTSPLRGKEHNRRVHAERAREEKAWRVEEERRKAGVTAATYLADGMRGVTGMHWASMRARWLERGGNSDALWRAVRHGPYQFKRERDLGGELYVYHEA